MMLEQQATTVEEILRRDVGWAAYALADLQPAFAPFCRWLIGASSAGEGLVLLYDGLTPPALVSVGSADAVEVALATAHLPDAVYLNVPYDHLPVIDRWYDGAADRRPMVRMVYGGELDVVAVNGQGPLRLGPEDVSRIRALYRFGGPFAPDAFAPYQVENGLFYGVAGDEGELLAVGGTHIVDWTRAAWPRSATCTHIRRSVARATQA